MDEGGADAGVAVATEERVGVAVRHGALAVLINLVIAAAVSVEGGGVMEDVGHAAKGRRCLKRVRLKETVSMCSFTLVSTELKRKQTKYRCFPGKRW